MTKEKIAFVVVRYGKDINGGAEYHCRMLAERLVNDYDVEVLTTCVKNYVTGENEYPEGKETLNGVWYVDSIRTLLSRTYIRAMCDKRLRQRSGDTFCIDVVF